MLRLEKRHARCLATLIATLSKSALIVFQRLTPGKAGSYNLAAAEIVG
jgi:hypothetical protein